jgi:hypothetical protein
MILVLIDHLGGKKFQASAIEFQGLLHSDGPGMTFVTGETQLFGSN